LKDTKAIIHTFKNKIKVNIFGKSKYGNEEWRKANNDWYEDMHDGNYLLHEDFIKYFKKRDITSILEVGCGTGIYPIRKKDLFVNKRYTGIDFSHENIEYCKKNSQFKFIAGDFIAMNINEKFDLVFSHAVLDHVYDIQGFISKIVQSTKKFAYINTQMGYFPDLKKHKMKWNDDDHCYYNDLSIIQLKENLIEAGLSEDEFVIRSQKSGRAGYELQTVIEIDKKL
jgi:SAM-dependent methyltransferase|tara:strand:- start:627 stop:1304 length:678 start_codon:yes stop_codon:yes gene_type:complete